MKSVLTYLVVGVLALGLTLLSNGIERDLGGTGWGFPFFNAIARPALLHDNSNFLGFMANIVVYGVIVLTAVHLMQSGYTQPPRLKPSLYFLLPATGVVGILFIGAGVGYNPFPMTGYRVLTPTPTPAHIAALMQRWSGTDATTGQPLTLYFGGYEMSLRTPDGEFKGTYTWITPERLVLRLGRYIEVDAETTSRPCPPLPTVFNTPCQQQPGRGYPSPILITPIAQPQGFYPGPPPEPTVVEPYGLYQGIEAAYQVVVTRIDLTLIAPTGESQSFTAVP